MHNSHLRRLVTIAILFIASLFAATVPARGSSSRANAVQTQGTYLVQMLDHFGGTYMARVSGRDANLPASVNGHDEFAADWTRRMLANLKGVPASVVRQTFATPGFFGLPASRPGENIIIVVPGSRRPQQAVVVGSHYDGEPFSKGSAFDDTSGSVVILALAREMAAEWRAHGLPSRTVEFVLFDAEEQGLMGSLAYAFSIRHQAIMPKPVFMIDEEQNGVGYPVRPFGQRDATLLPTYATTTGPLAPLAQRLVGSVKQAKPQALTTALQRLNEATNVAWKAMRAGYPTIDYRGGAAPAFTNKDKQLLVMGPDTPICCSDNDPFEALGLPTVTISGDFHYYDQTKPSWAYPFDQPQDTPQALACDTGGSSTPSAALEAALTLPAQLSIPLINEYAAPASGSRIAILSSNPGLTMTLHAAGSGAMRWQFGDGRTGTGAAVQHTYQKSGTYRVTVQTSRGATTIVAVHVTGHTAAFSSPISPLRPPPIRPWQPDELQGMANCG